MNDVDVFDRMAASLAQEFADFTPEVRKAAAGHDGMPATRPAQGHRA